MANSDVRSAAKNAGVFLYQVADRLKISEPTMTRLLRRELSEGKKQQLKEIISDLAAEQRADTNAK